MWWCHGRILPHVRLRHLPIRSSPPLSILTLWPHGLPPSGMSARFDRFDARPRRSYRMVLTYVDASAGSGKTTADSDMVEARFIDIVSGVRVVQDSRFVADDPDLAGTMTMTWEVTAIDSGMRVDIRAEKVPTGISAEDHAVGLASSLANLAAHVEPGTTSRANRPLISRCAVTPLSGDVEDDGARAKIQSGLRAEHVWPDALLGDEQSHLVQIDRITARGAGRCQRLTIRSGEAG